MVKEKMVETSEEFIDELKPGTKLLQGQFTIVKFINAGGFGITYLAKNSLDREIVIKECFPGSFCRRSHAMVAARSRAHENEFAQIVKLFVQEAKSLSRLIHPNIVGVHQVFEDNNTAYMAIDYIRGRDLLDIIDHERGSLTPQAIVSMLKKLLGAIGFVHDSGMLHRDISPDNILINSDGEPILIDFGAARQQATVIGGKALSALRVVKDGYSPQEFYVSGSQQSKASDLYALAASFYHVISGETPSSSQSRLVKLAESGTDPYVPLAGRYEGYPEGFLEAIDKAASVLPKDRLQSAQEWLDQISPRPELKVVPLAKRSGGEPVSVSAAGGDKAEKVRVAAEVAAALSAGRRRSAVVIGAALGGIVALLLALGLYLYAGGGGQSESGAEVQGSAAPVLPSPGGDDLARAWRVGAGEPPVLG